MEAIVFLSKAIAFGAVALFDLGVLASIVLGLIFIPDFLARRKVWATVELTSLLSVYVIIGIGLSWVCLIQLL